MAAKSSRWVNRPGSGAWPLGRKRSRKEADMFWSFILARASAGEREEKANYSGIIAGRVMFLKHLPKSWVTLNPVLATSAAIVTTSFHCMLEIGELWNSDYDFYCNTGGQYLKSIMSAPAIQLVGLMHPTEHSWYSHQQARLQTQQCTLNTTNKKTILFSHSFTI